MARFDIEVELVGHDGNAFAILGKVQRALRKAGASEKDVNEYLKDAKSGDYNRLLTTTMGWVNVV